MVGTHQQIVNIPQRGPAEHGGTGAHNERHRQSRLLRPSRAGEDRVIISLDQTHQILSKRMKIITLTKLMLFLLNLYI